MHPKRLAQLNGEPKLGSNRCALTNADPLGQMSSACGSDADAAARDAPDAEPLVPKLVVDLKGAGVDPAKVDEFISLLASCNVHSRGALHRSTA